MITNTSQFTMHEARPILCTTNDTQKKCSREFNVALDKKNVWSGMAEILSLPEQMPKGPVIEGARAPIQIREQHYIKGNYTGHSR